MSQGQIKMANKCARAYPGLLNHLNHFQFVALHREAGKCHQDLVGDKEREGLYNIVAFQESKKSWEGQGEAINHHRSMGSAGNFFSSFSPSFPVHLVSSIPSHPPSQPTSSSHKDPCRMLKESAFLYPSPPCNPSGAGEMAGEYSRGGPGDFGEVLQLCPRSRGWVLLFPLPSCGTGVTVSPPPSAAATLITIKLAVLEEMTTMGQSHSPWLRDDAGNH